MTLNILFFTIRINKRKWSAEELKQHEMIKQIEEENRSRQASMMRMFQAFLIKVVRQMTLNILFFTINIQKRSLTIEEIQHEQRIQKVEEEIRSRQANFPFMF